MRFYEFDRKGDGYLVKARDESEAIAAYIRVTNNKMSDTICIGDVTERVRKLDHLKQLIVLNPTAAVICFGKPIPQQRSHKDQPMLVFKFKQMTQDAGIREFLEVFGSNGAADCTLVVAKTVQEAIVRYAQAAGVGEVQAHSDFAGLVQPQEECLVKIHQFIGKLPLGTVLNLTPKRA